MRRLLAPLTVAAVLAAPAAAQAPSAVQIERSVPKSGTVVIVDAGPNELSTREESPGAIVLSLPADMQLSMRSRKRRCSDDQAAAARCPRASRIGFGHFVVRFAGYLFPGGETHAVATIVAHLGEPRVAGDLASIVLDVRPRGVEAVRKAVFQEFGVLLPELHFTYIGRIAPPAGAGFGHQLRFEGFPAGLRLPAPLSARVTRFKLAVGAVRRLKVPVIRRFRVPDVRGDRIRYRTRIIRDHRLVAHHLFRNPPTCDRSWQWELRVTFPSGDHVTTGERLCKNGKITVLPSKTPSPPQHS